MKKTNFAILSLFLLLCFKMQAAPFRTDSLYSKWIIDSRMGDFRNKTKTERFLTPYNSSNTATWDYVPGLVAKAILKAWEQYKDKPWSEYYFNGIQNYADNTAMVLGQSNIDDLNAAKIFFDHRQRLG